MGFNSGFKGLKDMEGKNHGSFEELTKYGTERLNVLLSQQPTYGLKVSFQRNTRALGKPTKIYVFTGVLLKFQIFWDTTV